MPQENSEIDRSVGRLGPSDYQRVAAVAAMCAAASGLLYSVSFVIVTRAAPAIGGGLAAAFLLLGSALGATALIGLHRRVVGVGGDFATLALAFGLAGALAAGLHGGYDLANALHQPGAVSTAASQVDPRGLGTFGLTGVSLLGFSWLLGRSDADARGLRTLGVVSGVLLLLVYLARLIVLDPSNPLVLAPAAVEGFIVNPAWYVWLGLVLRRG